MPFGELGVLDYTLASAPTVADGLAAMAGVFRVVSFGATAFEFARRGDGAGLLRFGGVFPPEVRDYGLAAFAARLRHVDAAPAQIAFVGPPFDDRRVYQRMLGRAPRFDAEANLLTLDGGDLDRPRHDDRYRGLRPIVGREVERLLSAVPEPTTSAQARRVIARLLPSATPELATVARELHTSPRTLQRRLTAEGTSIRALLEATRESLALAYLDAGRLRIAEIAYLLGYTEPGTFTAAFRRWRGHSPSAHRAPRRAR